MSERGRWGAVAAFALGMAWVEAAAVLYLRLLVDRLEPYQAEPLPDAGRWGNAELVREMATLVMLGAVGWLAGRTRRSRFGYACLAFGVWDIGYYVFLKILCGWPHSLLDWDLLFLIPLPWWGPVIAPVLIALLMIVGGALLGRFDSPERPLWPGRLATGGGVLGAVLALGVFMTDAARALPGGEAAVRRALPEHFHWSLFLLAWALMAVPVISLARQVRGDFGPRFERESARPAPSP